MKHDVWDWSDPKTLLDVPSPRLSGEPPTAGRHQVFSWVASLLSSSHTCEARMWSAVAWGTEDRGSLFAPQSSSPGACSVRPRCASMAHRPRAGARVDWRRTFRKNDYVQMTFSGASKKIRLSEKSLFLSCLGPACCVFSVRVCACFLCVCVCVSVCVTPVCRFKTPPCVPTKRPCVCRHHAHTCFNMCAWCQYTRGRLKRTHGGVLNGHTGAGRSFSE